MTKTQKIWMWIFLGMLLVPEVLWSPLGNFYYELIKGQHVSNILPFRFNFLESADYVNMLRLVILIQTAGSILGLITILKLKPGIAKWLSISALLITSAASLLACLYSFNLL